jgi:hypothetical protein
LALALPVKRTEAKWWSPEESRLTPTSHLIRRRFYRPLAGKDSVK